MSRITKKITSAFALMLIVAVMAVVAFYYISNKNIDDMDNITNLPKTEVGKLKAKDLEAKYPGTPSEVVKLYWRINKCMYNNSMSDDDLSALMKQLRKLYDDELLAVQSNSYENMMSSFIKDKAKYDDESITITTYTVQSFSDIDFVKVGGKECASVLSATMIKEKSSRKGSYEKFLCRRDSQGKWKILGWKKAKAKEVASILQE